MSVSAGCFALDARAVEMITLGCGFAQGVETGGLLLRLRGRSYATGPGPGAIQTPDRLEWEPSFVAGCYLTAMLLGADVIGRWHKHTAPVILASDEDRRSAHLFRRALGIEEIVDVIVACDSEDRPIGWSAYLCTEAGYERMQMEIPGGE